jgi:hypothetical protein
MDSERQLTAAERARVLRECAVDLIRASDLADSHDFAAVDSAARRIAHVIAELELMSQHVRCRAEWLERVAASQTTKKLVA